MNIEEAILSRKSVRRFLSTPVPRETVEKILQLAARAPSDANIQPWHIHVLTGSSKEQLSKDIIQAASDHPEQYQGEFLYYPQEWTEPYQSRRRKLGFDLYASEGVERHDKPARQRQMLRNFIFFDAPVGILVTMDRHFNIGGGFQDTSMFIMTLALAARQFGLHTCIQNSFSQYQEVARRHLDMPPEDILVCGISLGHEDPQAAVNHLDTERTPITEFTRFYD